MCVLKALNLQYQCLCQLVFHSPLCIDFLNQDFSFACHIFIHISSTQCIHKVSFSLQIKSRDRSQNKKSHLPSTQVSSLKIQKNLYSQYSLSLNYILLGSLSQNPINQNYLSLSPKIKLIAQNIIPKPHHNYYTIRLQTLLKTTNFYTNEKNGIPDSDPVCAS